MLREVAIKEIKADQTLQFRMALDEGTVERYQEIRNALPALKVIDVGGVLTLADGFHRLEAHRRAGAERVFVDVQAGDTREVQILAATANIQHGLPLKKAERDRAIVWMVDQRFRHDDIASKFGLDRTRVSQIATAAGSRRRSPDVQEKATATRTMAKRTRSPASDEPGKTEPATPQTEPGTPEPEVNYSLQGGPAQPAEEAATSVGGVEPGQNAQVADQARTVTVETKSYAEVARAGISGGPSRNDFVHLAPPNQTQSAPPVPTTTGDNPDPAPGPALESPVSEVPQEHRRAAMGPMKPQEELMLSLEVAEWRVLLGSAMNSSGYRIAGRLRDVVDKLLEKGKRLGVDLV